MGLRINTNVSSLSVLRNLTQHDFNQQRSLKRLSSGLRINSAADDPSGLAVADQFKTQISSLGQAVQNTQFASSLVSTAEGGLGEISTLLISIRAGIISGLSHTGDKDLLTLDQDTIDHAVASVDRIANTTRFGRTNLLNGGAEFRTSSVGSEITSLNLRSVFFGAGETSKTFTATLGTVASHAGLTIGSFATSGSGTLRITGNLGSTEIKLTSTTDVSGAINSVRAFTGVFASGGIALSEGFGSTERVKVAVVEGVGYSGTAGSDLGTDSVLTLVGAPTTAQGLQVSINGSILKGELTLDDDLAPGATFTFSVLRSGVNFQLGAGNTGSDSLRIGLASSESDFLGTPGLVPGGGASGVVGGFLSSIVAGGANDLDTNPTNALRIVDEALDQVNRQRGFLGAVEQQTLRPNVRSLGVAIENLSASESQIRDLNFAQEVAEFTRHQVLFAASISTLASSNLVQDRVLGLLS